MQSDCAPISLLNSIRLTSVMAQIVHFSSFRPFFFLLGVRDRIIDFFSSWLLPAVGSGGGRMHVPVH